MFLFVATAAAVPQTLNVARTTTPPIIDGRLDEPFWAEGASATDFLRYQPTAGGPPDSLTDVRFAQDDRNLYVGVRVSAVDYRVRARVSPREDINADDQIGIYLDTFHDGISGYIFYFNALGIQQDIRHNAGDWNTAWDTLLRSKGVVTDDGYTLEVAIPWRSLKFDLDGGTWGVILTRKTPHDGTKYSWPPLQPGEPLLFRQENLLVGIQPPRRGSGLELTPSLTASETWPRADGKLLDHFRPSLDARFGITPDVGLAATLNPDFSQVESDVSDVRLNAQFAFAFPEQRPFFLDGSDWFLDVGDTLYTRSMNAPLYGLKVGGREGPVSVGALQVLDRAPLTSFNERETPGFDELDGSMTSNTVLRTRVDAFSGGYAGLLVGDKRRTDGDGHHQVAGVDLSVPLGDRWVATTLMQHSFTTGDDTSLWGTRQLARIKRATGVGTGVDVQLDTSSPGYRNELGFFPRADLTHIWANVDHTYLPGGALDYLRPTLGVVSLDEGNGDQYRNVGGGLQTRWNGVHAVGMNGWAQTFRERGVRVNGFGASANLSSNLGRVFDLAIEVEGGRVIDFAALVPAGTGTATTTVTLRPTTGIRTDTTFRVNLHQPLGSPTQVSVLMRNRLNWQLSRAFGVRWVLDHSARHGLDPRTHNAVLLTWLRNPGTAFWLGASVTGGADASLAETTLFTKVTVLLRP